MMVLPALTTAAVFLAWPYPGLELILRIAASRRPRSPLRTATRRRHLAEAVRGGRLLAASLGGRAPPVGVARS